MEGLRVGSATFEIWGSSLNLTSESLRGVYDPKWEVPTLLCYTNIWEQPLYSCHGVVVFLFYDC